jgi:hypothetical protein
MTRTWRRGVKVVLEIHREDKLWAVTAYKGHKNRGVEVFGFVKREHREDALLEAVMMVLNAYPKAELELCGESDPGE